MGAVKTVGEFVALVKRMRECQTQYFDNKNPLALGLAKKYEKLVDQAIKERDERSAQEKQPELPACNQ